MVFKCNFSDNIKTFSFESIKKLLVFTNSYNTSGYIDLWELVPYGYIPSEAE